MKMLRKLPEAEELIQEYALDHAQKIKRSEFVKNIEDILAGRNERKLLIIGPCSADREDAVLEYVLLLAKLQEKVSEKVILIPRIYTSKPRTNGQGYKGILHSPFLDESRESIMDGVIATRKLHLHVIQQTGMFGADELLYPESVCYTMDLLSYMAVGARSVEDQAHRMVASGIDIPVGMKNPTSGDTQVLLNGINAAQHSHLMMYRGWETITEGNLFAHAVLRGYVDKTGKMYPNYHYENLRDFHDEYKKFNLKNQAVIVDCNHCNSGKDYLEQIRIAKEVISFCRENSAINSFVKGLMIESYLVDGKQMPGSNVYGRSITDGCLGWERTERLVETLVDFM